MKIGSIMRKIGKVMDDIWNFQVGADVWFFSFMGVMAIRTFVKTFLVGIGATAEEVMIDYIHELFFFFIAFSLIWLFLSFILKKNPRELLGTFFWASWLVIFPPIIDMARTGGGGFWSFYLLGTPRELWLEFNSFFGNLPSGIVYFGTKMLCVAVILLTIGLVYHKSKSVFKAAFSALGVYAILFFMGAFPTFFAWAYYFFAGTKKISEIGATAVMQLEGGTKMIFGIGFNNIKYAMAYNLNLIFFLAAIFLSAALFFYADKKKFWAVAGNARIPQLVYHAGLFFIGLGLGYLAYPENFNTDFFSWVAALCLLLGIWSAWEASVIINDIYDFEIDKISNVDRPLQKGMFKMKEYAGLGIIFFTASLLGGLVVDLKFAAILGIYQFLAWAYSAKPYRLKKFPVLATFVSALASLLVLFMGFTLFSGSQNIHGLSWRIILLILIAFTLSLPIKDFKDIEGDRKDNIWTIPVIFGAEKGRLIVAIGVFISFLLSVFLLNEFRLFWWAVLSGGAAFLVIQNTKPRQLFWPVLGVVSIYGLIVTKIIFL